MDLKLIANALDSAIERVAKAEWAHLFEPLSFGEREESVVNALKSLDMLKSGISPDYNKKGVALFYLTWYQPRQINLTYAIAVRLLRKSPRPLYIVDIGCGALATPIAMAVALAASDMSRSNVRVEVHAIDPSEPMKSVGRRLWREFFSIVKQSPELSRLWMAGNLFNFNYYSSLDDYCKSNIHPTPNCWVMAIHAVYKSNVNHLKRSFKGFRGKFDPEYEIVTCHEIGLEWAQSLCRANVRSQPLEPYDFSGDLSNTTLWRQTLANQFPHSDLIIGRFLQTPVRWKVPQRDKVLIWRTSGSGPRQ